MTQLSLSPPKTTLLYYYPYSFLFCSLVFSCYILLGWSNYSIVFILTLCCWHSNLYIPNSVSHLEFQMFAVYLHLDAPRASQIQLTKNRTYYLTSKSAFPAIFSVSVYNTSLPEVQAHFCLLTFNSPDLTQHIVGLLKYLLSRFPPCSRC